jgi:ABC-2 type transport system permease protein
MPGVFVGYLQMALILGLGAWFFAINPMPVIVPMVVVGGLFIAANLALGLLISTAVQTQAQAMQLCLLTLLPNILLSGFMFPVTAMPRVVQWFAECLPLTHFLRIDRGLLLKGADLSQLGGDIAALSAVLLVLVALAAVRVRTRLG